MHVALAEQLYEAGSHPFLNGIATLWIFSAAVSAMCEPDKNSSAGYQWLYRFTHVLAANLDRSGLFNDVSGKATNEMSNK